MEIKSEQFNNIIKKMRNVKLDETAKTRIHEKLIHHMYSYNPTPQESAAPTTTYFNFSYSSYTVAFTSFALMFFVSISTGYASQNSLPGDFLYNIKTHVTEPIIELTKLNKSDKKQFQLALADERIKEVEELVKTDKVTKEKLNQNFILFEKHIAEKEPALTKEEIKEKSTVVLLNIENKTELKSALSKTEATNSKIDKYKTLMLSDPALTNFYENEAKNKLDKIKEYAEKNADDLTTEEIKQLVNQIDKELNEIEEVQARNETEFELEIKDII